ncbi:iron chelate uptake ABC transporter family permease subunit [Parafrankia sp. EAN1pec]|uniref:iron chelate uptake ABC transporter family permease subunit n=1 Tax=Parafrankia sp. (strain EAN1pec) TaxID=298653 RepID=UPI00005427D1
MLVGSLLAVTLTAIIAGFPGVIGFVGLVAPHIARLFIRAGKVPAPTKVRT